MTHLGPFELDRVHLGDCIELMRALPDKCVDCVVTDPPYGINYQCGTRIIKYDKIANDDGLEFLDEFFVESFRLMVDNSHIYCFCSWRTYSQFTFSCESAGFKLIACIVWDKGKSGSGLGDIQAGFSRTHEFCLVASKGRRLWETARPMDILRYSSIQNVIHPTEKPVNLMSKILDFATNQNDIILDPFSGSGTTGVAAIKTGRRFLGFEIDPRWVDLANKRIEAAKSQQTLDLS